MERIAIVVGKRKPEAKSLGDEIRAWLKTRGHKVITSISKTNLCSGLDLVITLGGDGLVLGTADKIAKFKIPLLGVNFGHKGYLCDVEPEEVFEKLEGFFSGKYSIVPKTRIKAEVFQDGKSVAEIDALNEILVGGINRVVFAEMEVIEGKKKFTAQAAGDGILISTSTGSTAYVVNAGGSVLLADNVFCVVSSNATFESDFLPRNTKSFVTSTEAIFRIRSSDHRKSNLPYVIADGQRDYRLKDGDLITIKKSSHSTLFVKIE